MVSAAAGGAWRTVAVGELRNLKGEAGDCAGMPQELKPIRAFIAIALPEEARRVIADFQREWQTGLRGNFIRWTPVEQIHLTLRFLGNIPSSAVPQLESALQRACEEVAGFELIATGSGCFPDARKPRVLWVGVGGDVEALARLQWRIADETRTWGEVEARDFRAHLTLGRVKDAPGFVAREIAHRAQSLVCGELGRWRVSEVLLMRSELSPAGAQHEVLARCVLVG